MKVKGTVLLILILLASKIHCQKHVVKLDKDFFVIGTLSEEMGRKKASKDEETIEKSQFKRFIMKYNFNLLKSDYDDLVLDSSKTYNEHIDFTNFVLKSRKFAAKVNPLYSYDFDSKWIDVDDHGEITDSIATGTLKKNIFKNKRQRLSFITGVYCVYGIPNQSRYCIRFINSAGKYFVCEAILKKLGCKNVELIMTKNIPWSETIYFEPTDLLKAYFDEFKFVVKKVNIERDEITERMNNYYESLKVK